MERKPITRLMFTGVFLFILILGAWFIFFG
jgi:hypothetical protein